MSIAVAIKPKKKLKINIPRILLHTFFIIFSLCFILPMLLVLGISFTDEDSLRTLGYHIIPKVFSSQAYQLIFKNPKAIIDAYKVTIFTTIIGTVLSILVMSMIGYALSRRNFKARGVLTFLVYFTMLFSGGLVPSYIVNTTYLHLGDTVWIYLLPGMCSAFNIMMFTSFFRSLPVSLIESAKIDGATELRIYWSIIVPLSKPVMASITFLTILAKWNDWFTSLVYIRRRSDLYLLQYLLQKIFMEMDFINAMYKNAAAQTLIGTMQKTAPIETMQFAMAMIATGPMLVIFPFFQKYLARGLTLGAVKG